MRDFLLEHYKLINERLTQSDRNRDVWVGAYLTLMLGGLSFFFSLGPSGESWLKFFILSFLLSCGVIVAIYVAIARGWHCEFSHAAIAISKTFFDEELDLLKAARKFRQSREFTSYFNCRGTEFWVFILVLSCLAFELFLLLQIWSCTSSWLLWWKVLSCFLSFVIGIPLYWWCLKKRENQFPKRCYYSIPRRLRD
jgi:hypothetical protein